MTRDGRKCAISAGLVSGYGVVCVSTVSCGQMRYLAKLSTRRR